MATPLASRSDGLVIADQFLVERNRALPPVGGLQAFGATDQSSSRTDLMAVQIQRQFPARARAFQVLTTPIEGLLTPMATVKPVTAATRSAWHRLRPICWPGCAHGPRQS